MKILRVGERGEERFVASDDGVFGWGVHDLIGESPDQVTSPETLEAAREALRQKRGLAPIDLRQVRAGAPLAAIGKIVCVGLNYRRHAREARMSVPAEPILFLKAPDTVIGSSDEVLIPHGSLKTDYEVELGVVIGRSARYLSSPTEAVQHIAGYLIADDVSEREFQLERSGQWDKGKNCETFCPLGPWFVTADEVVDPQALRLQTWVDGELRQDSSTSDMIFPVDHLIWYISQFMVLYPGDVVLTGTPEGVGSGFTPQRFISHDSIVQMQIDGLGVQRHRFVSSRERHV